MKITGLIFDLGGVVFDCSFDRTFDTWATLTGKPAEEIKREFKFSDNFEKFERSEISPRQFMESVSEQLNYKFDYATFEKGWNAIYLNIIRDIDHLLIELKRNYRIVALTNTNSAHALVWPEKYSDNLRHFEKIFSSHEMGIRKPEAKAFQTVLDCLNISAQQTIFLDDKEEYIEGAEQLGINTVLVTSYSQMLNGLKKFGIKIEGQ